jgi:O-antigen/teichoic acid export membrane protein
VTAPALIARNATTLALASVWTWGLLFVWQIFLARWLGAHDYGVYGTIGTLLGVTATIPEFGVGLLVVRDIARRRADAGRYLRAALVIQLPLTLLAYVAVLAVSAALGFAPPLRRLLAFAALSLIIDVLGNVCHNQLLAAERISLTAAIGTGHVLLLTGLGVVTVGTGGGLWGLYEAVLLASGARAAAYWLALLRLGCRPAGPVEAALVRALLARGWPLAVNALLALAYIHVDKLITLRVLGLAAAGQLVAAYVVVYGVIELTSTTLLVAVLPTMSRLSAAVSPTAIHRLIERLVGLALTLGLPVAICLSCLAPSLTRLVFGAGYGPTADALRVLGWYALTRMVGNVFSMSLTIQDRQSRLPAIRAAQLLVGAVLAFALLPRLGIAGPAFAMLATELLGLGLLLRASGVGTTLSRLIVRRGLRTLPAALALGGAVLLLRSISPMTALVVGLPIYATAILIGGGATREDRALLKRLLVAWWDGGPSAPRIAAGPR